MRIVIDIPDKQYELIRQSDYNVFGMLASKECMMYAIKNGTILQKGHGRLIDADDIDNHIIGHVDTRCCPTIIPADKGEGE